MGRPKSHAGMLSGSQPPLMPRITNPPTATTLSESHTATALHDINMALSQPDESVTDAYPLSLSVPDMMFLDSISHEDLGGEHGIAYSDFNSQASDSTGDNATLPLENFNKGALHLDTSYLDRQFSPQLIESDHQVSEFNLKLARRLQQCQSFFRRKDGSSKVANTTGSEPLVLDKDDISNQETTLFGYTLSDTSEFLAIVQAYASDEFNKFSDTGIRNKGCHNIKNNFGTSSCSRPGLILTLNLISAYLQLVQIYEELFSCLSRKLVSGYSEAAFDMQIFPQLQLAGFSVQQGNLQIKIFIQTTVHQFEMIEKALGLPPDLRVTDKQDAYLGFLEDETAKNILDAISGGKLYSEALGEHDGPRALVSLRSHLKRVWTLSEG
ncbi:uncharacterized protein TRUGW13939_06287 [Talaromyces rugulosus]|uniref:Aflatoxin regulatory protein domain-containing protein n=1 Tax=Talaromyces rugulosus TaxID=121627 RepID=A0A7H8R0C2_TALRU|nr:uncharacterized protein TRUGW13939_06287 [Talaromyces rugulosus]QKX59155.1 hypothetical protein TRUGW13939_06287 [Talaromyces rugulosus]